ncbi:MAG: hypothetical protein QOJ98_694, partial [Acidobacteriota bacterium]|nr:hypothetical protein [Acidobacteriota bacterium]
MGNNLKSRLHYEGLVYSGDALLETSELLFRGERRLAIAFNLIESVEAKEGTLRVQFTGGLAELELGVEAAKWAEKIRNPKSVIQKLGV